MRRRWLGHVWNPHSLPSSTRKYPAEPSSRVREARAREWHIFAAVRSSQDLGRRVRSTRRVHGTDFEGPACQVSFSPLRPRTARSKHRSSSLDTRASPRPADAQTASWHAHTCSLYHHHELILPTICLKVSGPHWHAILDASKEVPEKIFHSNPFCRRM